MSNDKEFDEDVKKIKNAVIYCIIGAVLMFTLFSSTVIVDAGNRGVVLRMGAVEDRILGEGFHVITPFVERVREIEVRTIKYEAQATAASKDLQDTQTTVALNYHLDVARVNEIYQTLGVAYDTRYIAPAIQEVVKASTANYNAEQLITERPRIKAEIEKGLRDRLEIRGIIVEQVSITDFKFSEMFSKAIEEKVTAQQLAFKATNDLQRITIEAQQKVATARGEAEAIRIINEELQKSPNYIQWQAVQKWSGILPLVTGGGIPLINLPLTQTATTSG
jgi:regulator of protease activity HflC (stomatin/prohibitin superfamily)